MASQTWVVFDTVNNRKCATLNNVTPSVYLTAVTLTNGSPTVTFTLGTGQAVFPGMLLVGKGVPTGTTILSVDGTAAGVTTLTMSGNASAAGSGLQVLARSYIPYQSDGSLDTRLINLEHYRDLWTGSTSMQMLQGSPIANAGSVIMPGFGLIVPAPSLKAGTGGTLGAVSVEGEVEPVISDNLTHTPPREQTQKVSFVNFILDDGTCCPVCRFPGYDILRYS